MSGPHFDIPDAQRLLIRIGGAARRYELDSARMDERQLFLKTLQSIAAGHRDPQRMAATALQATELVFDRADDDGR